MTPLPDDALVVRGGQNLPDSFAHGSGVSVDAGRNLEGVSVNAAVGASLEELTAPNPQTGYSAFPTTRWVLQPSAPFGPAAVTSSLPRRGAIRSTRPSVGSLRNRRANSSG